jgi:glycosyltransferase involved in cell wall biosynthesis
MLITRFLGQSPPHAYSDALRALPQFDWTNPERRPALLPYFPVVWGNPYQSLLYGSLPEHGVRAVPTYDAASTLRLVETVADSDLDVVVHVHWLYQVLGKVSSEAGGRAAIEQFMGNLHAMHAVGARLIWTVHNILPHESRYPDLDAELRSEVASLVDRIHVMSPATSDLVSPWFRIPQDRMMVIPHPSYDDVYPGWMSRDQARQQLGIDPGATVFVMVGRMKPYKGLTEALEAFDRLTAACPGKYVLLAAGPPDSEPETLAFRDAALTHPAVMAALRRIPDTEMQVYLKAADVAIFPYRRSLNSGAMALALTFGLPLVVPLQSGEAANVEPTFAVTYDASEADGLLQALHQAASQLCTPAARDAARAAGQRVAAPAVAELFASSVRDLITTGSDAKASRPS